MRLNNSNLIEIGKPQQTLLVNRGQDGLVNSSIHLSRGRMPYYMDWASHNSIIAGIRAIGATHA